MKIVMINGSHRKNGTTAAILNALYRELEKYHDVEVQLFHVADLSLNYCVGCGRCYKMGNCIYKDDAERLSSELESADGIILGSPTYAANVSAQMKTIIDRGHLVMEQLLYGKYAVTVTTYENYGGRESAKILNRLLAHSGAKISGTIIFKKKNDWRVSGRQRLDAHVKEVAGTLYQDIRVKRKYVFQSLRQLIIFKVGIKPFIIKNEAQYAGVIRCWERKNIN